jgi:large subunit ribosomal protein L17
MRHHKRGRKLGRDAAHRDALMMNMAAQLILHGRIRTTLPKAKELRPYVEKLVTRARKGDIHDRRIVFKKLRMNDKRSSRKAGVQTPVQKLFSEIAPRFADRPGGYTRIVKLGPRPGDAAPMAFLEWVDYVPQPKAAKHTHDHDHDHAHTHDHEHAAAAT